MGKQLTDDEAKKLILEHDIDGSGDLKFEEFKKIFADSDMELKDLRKID
jgi:Ca2+-binding EF-hand superfamily protein